MKLASSVRLLTVYIRLRLVRNPVAHMAQLGSFHGRAGARRLQTLASVPVETDVNPLPSCQREEARRLTLAGGTGATRGLLGREGLLLQRHAGFRRVCEEGVPRGLQISRGEERLRVPPPVAVLAHTLVSLINLFRYSPELAGSATFCFLLGLPTTVSFFSFILSLLKMNMASPALFK